MERMAVYGATPTSSSAPVSAIGTRNYRKSLQYTSIHWASLHQTISITPFDSRPHTAGSPAIVWLFSSNHDVLCNDVTHRETSFCGFARSQADVGIIGHFWPASRERHCDPRFWTLITFIGVCHRQSRCRLPMTAAMLQAHPQ